MKTGMVLAVLASTALSGCGMISGMMGGGGGGSYKPTECFNNQYFGDLADAKEGRFVTYVSEASGSKSSQTVKVVGKEGSDFLIEHWMDMGSMAYGFLFRVGADKKITKAWAAAKGDKEWTAITVKDPPAAQGGESSKPVIKESSEKKDVKAGGFDCKRLDVTVNVQGKDYTSVTWYSRDVPRIYIGSEHGGAVAMEASGSTTALEAKGEDGKPTMELPKK